MLEYVCNNTTPGYLHGHSHDVNIILSTISCAIFLVGVVGNILVIYVFKFQHNTRSVTENLIIYLAIGDLLGSLINPFVFTYLRLTFSHLWHFGPIGCKILPSLQKITISLSIGIILLIAIYRCLMICQIYIHSFNLRLFVTTIVVLSIITRIPYTMHLHVKCGRCNGQMEDNDITLSILITEDLIFILIFTTALCFIYKRLYNKEARKVLRNQVDLQRNKKVVFMLVIMASIFLATVLPRHVFLIVIGFRQSTHLLNWKTKQIVSTLELVYMCNSVCNPFIYGKLHTQFRKSVIKSMRGISQRGRLLISTKRGRPHENGRMYGNAAHSLAEAKFVLRRPLKEKLKVKARKDVQNGKELLVRFKDSNV